MHNEGKQSIYIEWFDGKNKRKNGIAKSWEGYNTVYALILPTKQNKEKTIGNFESWSIM